MEITLAPADRQVLIAEIVSTLKTYLEQISPESRPGVQKNSETLTIDDVCSHLNVTKRWVRRQITENKIKHFKAGHQIRFKRSDIDRYIESHQVLPPLPHVIPARKAR